MTPDIAELAEQIRHANHGILDLEIQLGDQCAEIERMVAAARTTKRELARARQDQEHRVAELLERLDG